MKLLEAIDVLRPEGLVACQAGTSGQPGAVRAKIGAWASRGAGLKDAFAVTDDLEGAGAPSRGPMANTRITINGRQYDSPEAMPPDVRRVYEEAMRAMGPSRASGQGGGNTQVFTGRAGERFGASVIVNKTITVNDRTYGSLDELPPEVRQQFEDALKGAGPKMRPTTSLHVSLNMGGPQVRTLVDAHEPPKPAPLPIEPSSIESRIRDIPVSLAILVIIGLVLWAFLR